MPPANIVSLTIAIVSAVSSLLTIAYVSIKTKFQDKQDTNIAIKLGASHNKPPAEIIITLKNDESFSHKLTSIKNGKQDKDSRSTFSQITSGEEVINFEDDDELQSIKSKIVKTIKEHKTPKEKIQKDSKSAPSLHQKFLMHQKNNEASNSFALSEDKSITAGKDLTNFSQHALLANNEGDKLIADNRNNLIKKSLYVFNNIITTLYGDENQNKAEHMRGTKFSMKVNDFFEEFPDDDYKAKIKFHDPLIQRKSSSPEITKKTTKQQEDTKDNGKEDNIEQINRIDTQIKEYTIVEIGSYSNIDESSNEN